MADDFTISIDTTEMDKALAALPRKFAGRIAKEALQAAGDVMLGSMQVLCPERTDTPTPGSNALAPGVLKESLTTQVQIGTTNPPRVKVGPPSETAHVGWWIENGFDHYEGGRKGKGSKGKHIDGKHFMASAFDESAERAVEVLLERLGSALDVESGDLEGVGADNDLDYGDD